MSLRPLFRRASDVLRRAAVPFLALVLASCAGSGPPVPEWPVHIVSLGQAVNSPADDFAPTLSADGRSLVFTSKRRGASDFFSTSFDGSFWTPAANAGSPLNGGANQGASSLSPDGQILYFASCQREGGIGSCDLWMSHRGPSSWQSPTLLGPPVSTSAWESQPSIAPDGRSLFFVSDRAGGMGGLDLWVARLQQDGSWSVRNLGAPINTSRDDVSPSIAADGATLYFSSNGHGGAGGTDLFVTRFDGHTWSPPQNMGRPINSPGDDEFCALSAEGSTLTLASRRPGGQGGLDLYTATPNPWPPGVVTLVHGRVTDRFTALPLAARLEVRVEDNGTLHTSVSTDSVTGEFLFVLPSGTRYRLLVSATGHEDSVAVLDFRGRTVFHSHRLDVRLRGQREGGTLAAVLAHDLPPGGVSLPGAAAQRADLVAEDIVTVTTVPLLPYVFFAARSAELDPRYSHTGPPFTPRLDPGVSSEEGTLRLYRRLLDITGALLRTRPDLRLTLVGAGDRGEPVGLGLARAQTIARILRDTWAVDPARITVQGRDLPASPSSSSTDEGREENRRVEFVFSDPEVGILGFRDTLRIPRPSVLPLRLASRTPVGIDRWDVTASVDGRSIFARSGQGAHPDTLVWNWSTVGLRDSAHIALAFRIVDKAGRTVEADPDTLLVRILTLERKQEERLRNVLVEKISLILFDFDKAEVSERNLSLLRSAVSRITPSSSVLVRGTTDALGSEEYNDELSLRRAESVRNALITLGVQAPLRTEGWGERDLPYPVDTPEGRFYCRTVRVLIETER